MGKTAKITALCNQKGGVGNEKKKIMESPSSKVLEIWHNAQKDFP